MAKPTAAELEEFLRNQAEARDLEKRARTKRERNALLAEQFATYLGERTSRTCHGFQLQRIEVDGRVSWSKAYLEDVGAEAAEARKRREPKVRRIEVTAP